MSSTDSDGPIFGGRAVGKKRIFYDWTETLVLPDGENPEPSHVYPYLNRNNGSRVDVEVLYLFKNKAEKEAFETETKGKKKHMKRTQKYTSPATKAKKKFASEPSAPTAVTVIDGTVRPICRPSNDQRLVYNGHKKVHSLKFQSVALPNGIIGNLFGPIEGRRHDCFLLRESGILGSLNQFAFNSQREPLCLYGDPAYPVRIHLQSPFQGPYLNDLQKELNTKMSGVRTSVEWLFGDITNWFAFMDYKKNLKLNLSAVGKCIWCAVF